jgi:selT/selW/selH-like putative selenoprotein
LAAAIKEEFGVDTELIQGGGGIFLVIADGVTLFSKKEAGRFPEHEEVLAQLRNR